MNPAVPSSQPRSVLVICVRYLGDTLLLRPPLRALRCAFPHAQIDALVSAGTAVALDDCRHVDRVIEWPKTFGLDTLGVAGGIFLRGYDWAVDYTGNDRSAMITLLTRASLRVAYDRSKISRFALQRATYNFRPLHKKKKPHTIIQRLEMIEPCGVPPQGVQCDLVPRSDDSAWVERTMAGQPRPRLHVHVTSRDMQKAIPEHIVRDVVRDWTARGGGAVVTTGPADVETSHVSRCLEGLDVSNVRVFSSLSWHQLVAMIASCDKYWGADTAPAHVASSLEKPLLIHYGPTRSDHWFPLHLGGCRDARPCECLGKNVAVKCPPGRPGRCLEALDSSAVIAAIAALK